MFDAICLLCTKRAKCAGLCSNHYEHLRVSRNPECSVPECLKQSSNRGLCPMHLNRLRLHGSLADPRLSEWDRFWSHVVVGLCWEWCSADNGQTGHGRFTLKGGQPIKAYRWAWESLVGPIPAGLVIDHLCRNPKCVNPDHLEPVTQAENLRRGRLARHQ